MTKEENLFCFYVTVTGGDGVSGKSQKLLERQIYAPAAIRTTRADERKDGDHETTAP